MPRAKGYRTYRGASKKRGGVLIALVVLLALAGGTVVYLQRYLVYGEDGVFLDLPFLRSAPPAEEEAPPPPQEPEEEPPPEEPDPPSRRAILGTLRAVTVEPDVLMHADAPPLSAQLAGNWGTNAWLLQMKNEKGLLLWSSGAEPAAAAGASAQGAAPAVTEAAVAEADEMFWRVARISCFRDDTASRLAAMPRLQTAGGVRWYDRDFLGWLNPYSAEAQDYILALAAELAEMGFDEILLEHFGFPVRGKMELLSYGTQVPFPDAVDAFLARMAETLAPYNVTLSAVTDAETVLTGENKLSGHTLVSLAARVDRICIPCEPEEYPALLAAAVEAGFKPDAVVMLTGKAPEGLDCSWILVK